MQLELKEINALVEKESDFIRKTIEETQKVIVGQNYIIERFLIGVLTGGHLLLEGVPGLAKTLSIKTLAQVFDVKFKRIQFTPDLLPADIIGTLIYNPVKQEFIPKLGPIFANFVLADEINRAPAKVQSALLEAMQEKQVTLADKTYLLKEPFLVLATQNPIEQEGTYNLPEAQVDRFLMKLKIGYPTKEEEKQILDRMTQSEMPKASKIIDGESILKARETVQKIYVDEKIKDYVLDIVFATRNPQEYGLEKLSDMISFGASPRASINLASACKAYAFIKRRGYVIPEDVRSLCFDVLRHRIGLTYEAEAENITTENIITEILNAVEIP